MRRINRHVFLETQGMNMNSPPSTTKLSDNIFRQKFRIRAGYIDIRILDEQITIEHVLEGKNLSLFPCSVDIFVAIHIFYECKGAAFF